MEIVQFEKAFRAARARDTMQPIFAAPGLAMPVDVNVPEEFQSAAKTLALRLTKTPTQDGLLHAAAQWG